jgi:hypothetical protein
MKNTSILTLCLLITFTASISFGQKARPRSNAAKPKTATKAVAKGNLELEAGLIFNSGDVKPVGRATFYVLKENAEKVILTQEMLNIFNQESTYGKKDSLDKWSLYGAILYMDGRYTPNYAIAAKKALDTASVSSGTTGFDGKVTIPNIPIGNYFIFGYYTVGKQTTYWNTPVSIKAGANKLVLDNDNTH